MVAIFEIIFSVKWFKKGTTALQVVQENNFMFFSPNILNYKLVTDKINIYIF